MNAGTAGASRISIVLCTCNGAEHLQRQLQSIASQSRLPDELVISDDVSTDGTNQVVEAFARGAAFPVVHRVNSERLGVARNFEQAIRRATGELIFLADQDDVWQPQKLRTFEGYFDRFPACALVFSDLAIVDEQLACLGPRQWERLGFDRKLQRLVDRGRAFELLLRFNVVNGNAMAFRADLRDWALPIPTGYLHDEWIALIAAACGEVGKIPQALTLYRQHGQQEVGGAVDGLWAQLSYARRKMGKPYFERMVERSVALSDRLEQIREGVRDPRFLVWVQERVAHATTRLRMRERGLGRLPLALGEMFRGNYRRFGYGWKSLAQDLVLA